VLFLGQETYKLEKPYAFDTAFLSLMERYVNSFTVSPCAFTSLSNLCSDPTDELLMIIGIFTHFFAIETTLAERQFFRALARLVGRRAARLSACGIAAIVSKTGYIEEGCSVGADGSLYNVSRWLSILFIDHLLISGAKKYPKFPDRVHEGLVDIFGEKGRCVMFPVNDLLSPLI
jgi:hexokinase